MEKPDSGPSEAASGQFDGDVSFSGRAAELIEILRRELRERRNDLATVRLELRMVTMDRDQLKRELCVLDSALSISRNQAEAASRRAARVESALERTTVACEALRSNRNELAEHLRAVRYRSEQQTTEREQFSRAVVMSLAAVVRRAQRPQRRSPLANGIRRRLTSPFTRAARRLGISSSEELRRLRDAQDIRRSGWLDERWYLETYPDVRAAGLDPAHHYLVHGAVDGRNPGPKFDSCFYLASNLDVAVAGMNPLVHFLRHGISEGRLPHPLAEEVRGLNAYSVGHGSR